MASIKNLQMASSVISNPDVTISKGFLGMGTKATYTPTNSPINVKKLDFTSEMGHRLKEVIEAPKGEFENRLAKGDAIKATQIGNVHAELCLSQDRQFAAIQLFVFSELLFRPITEVKFFTGKDAELLASLF